MAEARGSIYSALNSKTILGPVLAPLIHKLNVVRDFIILPWEVPIQAYVRTFFPAAKTAILSFFAPDVWEIARGAIKPKFSKKSFRRGERKKKPKTVKIYGETARVELPDLNEIAGKKIRGLYTGEAVTAGSALEKVMIANDAVLAGAYYWFLIDLASDFAYNWTSSIVKSEWTEEGLVQPRLAGKGFEEIIPLFSIRAMPIQSKNAGVGMNISTNNLYIDNPNSKTKIAIAYTGLIQENTRPHFTRYGILAFTMYAINEVGQTVQIAYNALGVTDASRNIDLVITAQGYYAKVWGVLEAIGSFSPYDYYSITPHVFAATRIDIIG